MHSTLHTARRWVGYSRLVLAPRSTLALLWHCLAHKYLDGEPVAVVDTPAGLQISYEDQTGRTTWV